MKHWSVDTTELEKYPEAFAVWKLEQAVNFGIRNGKVSERQLRKYWDISYRRWELLQLPTGKLLQLVIQQPTIQQEIFCFSQMEQEMLRLEPQLQQISLLFREGAWVSIYREELDQPDEIFFLSQLLLTMHMRP